MSTEALTCPAANASLKTTVDRLVTALDPDKPVLFGGHARGNARPDSDYDLMVVGPTHEPRPHALARAYAALGRHEISVDLVWYTPEEIEEWTEVPNFLATRALREGVALYEKEPR